MLTGNRKVNDVSISVVHAPVRVANGVRELDQISELRGGYHLLNLCMTVLVCQDYTRLQLLQVLEQVWQHMTAAFFKDVTYIRFIITFLTK